MANTFTSLHYHIVFSTKNRELWLRREIEENVWRYLGGICRTHAVTALQIGGIEDHVHLLVCIPPSLSVSDFVKRLKAELTKWLRREHAEMANFAWQDGYGAFTVGKSQISDTVHYIQNQRAHHSVTTFEAEYRKFPQGHGIEADERYLFG